MKRGKEDEKIMGPMFPRLHVNDTERGGPRAPPRNKMALYEQLTIPSQRYNTGVVPPNQNSDNKSAPSTSTRQGTSQEQNSYFPLHRPSPVPADVAIQVLNSEASNSNNSLTRVEHKKKPVEEDDFMVPIFSEAGTEMQTEKTSRRDAEGHLHLSSNNQRRLLTTVGEETNQSNNGHAVSKQQITEHDGRTLRLSASTRNSLDLSMNGRDDIPWANDPSLLREHQKKHRLSSLNSNSACLVEDHVNNLPVVDAGSDEDVPDLQRENPCKDTSLGLRLNSQTLSGFNGDDEINRRILRIDDDQYLEKESIDRGDDVSETSMVDSASEFDITPDDVVDVIGRKHFWKARTAIVNQQRVFAVQVFELHRLLKVQKLIAGSPNLLLEASAFVGKSSEYVVKALPNKGMQKEVTHRAIDKAEGTAENVGPKAPNPAPVPAPNPSEQHQIQPEGYPSFSSNTVVSPPGGMDPKMNPWGFHQPSAHQWLVPVMTRSEGLVYKPYPAPGFMGQVYGGCGPGGPTPMMSNGPGGPTPMMGNFMNPSFGGPIPQYQQGVGMPPGIHYGGQGYFPPYGMQMMSSGLSGSTVDHPNPFSGSNPYVQNDQQEGSSLNAEGEGQENVISCSATRPRAPKQKEQHRDPYPLSTAPSTTELSEDTPPKKQARVIRAVPHRSTSDSAARIFQSIQQERQLYESS